MLLINRDPQFTLAPIQPTVSLHWKMTYARLVWYWPSVEYLDSISEPYSSINQIKEICNFIFPLIISLYGKLIFPI